MADTGSDRNHSGCSTTQRESMPMWLGTMSLASRMPRAQRPVAQVGVGRLAAEVVGDPVVVQRVGGGDGIRVAAHPLDPLRRGRLRSHKPISHRPGDAPAGQPVKLLVGDGVEGPDIPAVARATAGPARRTCSWPCRTTLRHPRRVRREVAPARLPGHPSSASRSGRGRPRRVRPRSAASAPASPRPGSRWRSPACRSARPGQPAGSGPSGRGCSGADRPARSVSGEPELA